MALTSIPENGGASHDFNAPTMTREVWQALNELIQSAQLFIDVIKSIAEDKATNKLPGVISAYEKISNFSHSATVVKNYLLTRPGI
jgi:F0F1-type ATP synthase delta subunit